MSHACAHGLNYLLPVDKKNYKETARSDGYEKTKRRLILTTAIILITGSIVVITQFMLH